MDGADSRHWDDHDWFKVWTLLASHLAESNDLGPNARAACDIVIKAVRQSVAEMRDEVKPS